ncbi:hypothetical protein GBA52_026689 [Prunus armeniaca]|nr:hypothetical protein GBA52_026689 [Prunus armeniaca]
MAIGGFPLCGRYEVIPAAITYYVAGLHKGFEHFFYFACVLFACMMLVESLMMIVASIVPNFLIGIISRSWNSRAYDYVWRFLPTTKRYSQSLCGSSHCTTLRSHKYAYQGLFKIDS